MAIVRLRGNGALHDIVEGMMPSWVAPRASAPAGVVPGGPSSRACPPGRARVRAGGHGPGSSAAAIRRGRPASAGSSDSDRGGDTVTVDTGGLGTGTIHVLHPVQDQTLDLFAQTSAVSDGPWVDVVDSARHVTVGPIYGWWPTVPTSAHQAYPPFPVQTGRTYQIYEGAGPVKTSYSSTRCPSLRRRDQDALQPGHGRDGGESLETFGDLDRFRFQVEAGQSYVVYLAGPGFPASCTRIVVTILPGFWRRRSRGWSRTAPRCRWRPTRGPFRGCANRRYELEVGSAVFDLPRGTIRPGSYGVLVVRVDPRPEGLDSVLPRDTTISSAIDSPGDLDRFVSMPQPGQPQPRPPGTRWPSLLALYRDLD